MQITKLQKNNILYSGNENVLLYLESFLEFF